MGFLDQFRHLFWEVQGCADSISRTNFDFTDEQRQAIAQDRFHHVDPWVQRRMEVLWLKLQGETHERIAELAGVSH